MRNLKKVALVGMLSALFALPAAAETIVAYEVANSVVFTGTGAPGSTITVVATLSNPANHAQTIGSKNEWCMITGYGQYGPVLWCNESIVINGRGSMISAGYINQTLLEAYVPQTIAITSGAGQFAGKTGTQTIQQVVFPSEFLLTMVVN